MVERYKRLNYPIHQLERPIAINEGLSGIDIIELMAYLRQDNKILNIDAKPTDLIALSVRFKNPLYISDSIIKSNGVNICSKE